MLRQVSLVIVAVLVGSGVRAVAGRLCLRDGNTLFAVGGKEGEMLHVSMVRK